MVDERTPIAAMPLSLSPSRAADFKTCPLLYRYRAIDRLPEVRSSAAVRGTVVHAALEALFDLPMPERTEAAAVGLIDSAWERVVTDDPQVIEIFADDTADLSLPEWLDSARSLIGNYFRLEAPSAFDPAERELLVETEIDGLLLRGFVDRIDIAPDGSIRVVDYKTGATPREAFEGKALFQMKFYALVLWRTRGVVPAALKLIYLADVDTLTYTPSESELVRFEGTLKAIWAAIARAAMTGDFRPSPSKLCNWCDHKALCPSFGGTPPAYPSGTTSSSEATGASRETVVSELLKNEGD